MRWALDQLQIAWRDDEQGLRIELPEQDRSEFAGAESLLLTTTPQASAPAGPANRDASGEQVEPLAWHGRFGNWLRTRLEAAGPAVHARPDGAPLAVTDLSQRLFSAYEVENGQIHLAGCQLTDHPFLRLSYASNEPDDLQIRHVFVAPDGSTVGDELIPALGLDKLTPILKLAPRIDAPALRSLIAAGKRIATKSSTSRDPSAVAVDPLAIAVVWVRHAEGQLQFTIAEATATLACSGWASLLEPPPFVGPHSRTSSFHLAATDDGRIDVAEQITRCQQSNTRVLKQDLVQCAVTGKWVLSRFTEICPVCGLPALVEEFNTCAQCRQRVCRKVLQEGLCAACRELSKIRKDDPRLVWILGEHGGLDSWNHWQLGETQTVYIAIAQGLTKRLLVVVDKETLAVERLATGSRLSSRWVDVPTASHDDWL